MIVAIILIILHGPDGHEIRINPSQITSLHSPAGPKNKAFADGVNCMVGLADGKFASVVEPCLAVQRMLEDVK